MHVIERDSSTKAVMLYDGDCRFCQKWIRRWERATGEQIRYEPYQQMGKQFPEVTEPQCRDSVQLILRDRVVYYGAHAIFKALALAGKAGWLLQLYERFPLFGRLAEWIYRLIGRHRTFFSMLSILL